jgi:hypothetical protein
MGFGADADDNLDLARSSPKWAMGPARDRRCVPSERAGGGLRQGELADRSRYGPAAPGGPPAAHFVDDRGPVDEDDRQQYGDAYDLRRDRLR